jgi:modification methylase
MDCLEGMKQIPDGSIDLVVTSPPYNLGETHHTGNNRFSPYKDDLPEDEYQAQQIEVLSELYRILKPNGSIMYNHKNRIRDGKQITPYEWILKTKLIVKQEVVWFNGSQNFDKCRFYPMTERVYWLAKQIDTDFFNGINHHDFFNKDEWPSVGTNADHKRAFPLQFARYLVYCFPHAEVVLDPYMGSGTTAIACIKEHRHFIGFELSKEYFDKAVKRIKAEQAQLTLF